MRTTCAATRRDGAPCRTPALAEGFCFAHSPRLAEQRREAAARGGRNRSTAARASRGLPAHLASVQDKLVELIAAVEAGEIPARSAEVIGGLTGRLLDLAKFQAEQFELQELERQLDEFLGLLGHPPTHLDSHQHVHLEEPARSTLTAAGTRLGIPVRWCSPRVRYCGDFYGQAPRGEPYPEAITLDFLLALVAALSDGITELGCHPAIRPEAGSSYAEERPRELAVLRDPKVRDAIDAAGLRLISFAALGELIGAS